MTLYAIRPSSPNSHESLDDAPVIDQTKYGWQYLEQAVTVWQLVDEQRAARLEAVMARSSRAAGDGELRFFRQDLEQLVELLEGIEKTIADAGIIDKNWCVQPDRIDELAKRVPAMDLKTERTLEDKTFALGEVLGHVAEVREFLSDALKSDCVVVLG